MPVPSRRRVVVAGLGGASAGLDAVARALRDAGTEVVHAGAGQTAEQVVATALQEDAGALGLAVDDAALLARVVGLLREQDADDVAVVAVGAGLPAGGAHRVLPVGTAAGEVAAALRDGAARDGE